MQRAYVSNELVHWTGRKKSEKEAFETLKAICCENVLRLSYCPNYVSKDLNNDASMVCFTDIPLKHSQEHCDKFGRFGIAFHKDSMIRYGANPVHYTTAPHFERIKQVSFLLERMKDLEKDREFRQEEREQFSFSEDETAALLEVADFLQEYSYKNNDNVDYVSYYQREWRLTFNTLPFAGGTSEHLPGMSCFTKNGDMSYKIFKFSPRDVAFIVVPIRYLLSARMIARQLGCKLKIYEWAVRF
jgi:hypothetical protein